MTTFTVSTTWTDVPAIIKAYRVQFIENWVIFKDEQDDLIAAYPRQVVLKIRGSRA